MEVEGSLEPTESFRGAYERFRWDPLSAYDETLVVDELLNRSKRTLKVSTFRFKKPLPSPSSRISNDSPFDSSSTFPKTQSVTFLTCAIASSSSLQRLQLYGSVRQTDLKLLLHSRVLADSLPPSLARLFLALDLTSHDVLAFLRDLPATSDLKRLNCPSLTLGETEEMEEVLEKFSKRGIRLSFNEKWEI